MQTILVTGGTGMIGTALCRQLISSGYQVIILTRNTKNKQGNNDFQYAAWNINKQYIDLHAIQSADYIIHLAGTPVVEKRWTASYKKEILESRTKSSKLLIDTLQQNSNKVKAIISASAIGWYGPDKIKGYAFSETDPAADDFLGQTCLAWEQSVQPSAKMQVRVCMLRTGIVLDKNGGALESFIKPVRLGIAAILSGGQQMVSWIHIEDLCRMYIHAIVNENLIGSYNATATVPVSNKTLTLTLAKALRGKYFIPLHVPAVLLKLLMGKSSMEVLKSTTVSNKKIIDTGFTFKYPEIKSAINALCSKASQV